MGSVGVFRLETTATFYRESWKPFRQGFRPLSVQLDGEAQLSAWGQTELRVEMNRGAMAVSDELCLPEELGSLGFRFESNQSFLASLEADSHDD